MDIPNGGGLPGGIPPRIAEYKIDGVIAIGGMGIVLHAYDVSLGRRAAVKVLDKRYANDTTMRIRFEQEALILAAIQDDHIVPILKFGEQDGLLYIAMPLLRGETLEERLARLPLSIAEAVEIAAQIVEGLTAAHTRGGLHRDLKPANIFLEENEDGSFRRVRLIDFGLTRRLDGTSPALTNPRGWLGTPAYMAPEQARGEQVDARTDLFSIGVTFYEMVTGANPFDGPTPEAAIINIATIEPPPARSVNPAVPQQLSDLIARLLAKPRHIRPNSAQEVADALRALAV